MRLLVIGRYRNGEVRFEPGQVVDVSDAEGELLQRDSPGSFAPEQIAEAVTETVSGIKAVDRRGRGGQRR